MKRRLFFLVSLNLCCSLLGMDDEDDIYKGSGSVTKGHIYSMCSLTETNIYPIRIYEQKQKQKRKPFCGTRKQYADFFEYKRQKKESKRLHKNFLRDANTQDRRVLEEIYQDEKAVLKEAFFNALHGKFYIYTATNKDKKFENHWECWHAVEHEQEAIARLRMGNPLKPNDSIVRYDQWLIPVDKKALCAEMLKQFAYFFCGKKNELHEGPYITKKWGTLQRDGSRECKETKHEMIIFKASDFDLKDILQYWSHEEIKHILEQQLQKDASSTIPLTPFYYGSDNVHSDKHNAELEEEVYDVEAVLVEQVSKKSTESKVYKLS